MPRINLDARLVAPGSQVPLEVFSFRVGSQLEAAAKGPLSEGQNVHFNAALSATAYSATSQTVTEGSMPGTTLNTVVTKLIAELVRKNVIAGTVTGA